MFWLLTEKGSSQMRALFPARKARRSLPKRSSENERLVQLFAVHAIDTVVDVGANEGQYGLRLRAAGYPGRIVSIEPFRPAHAHLSAVASEDPDWIVAEPMAIGAVDGEAKLQVFNRSDMNALAPAAPATLEAFPKLHQVGEATVPVKRMDRAIHGLVPNFDASKTFLKVDAQGSEDAVLEGAGDLLGQLKGLQLELSFLSLYEGEKTYLDLLGRLAETGWATHLVISGHFSRRLSRQLQADFILFRE